MTDDPYAGCALIVVDAQQGFDDPSWGVRNNPACDDNIAALVDELSSHDRPLVYVRHDGTEEDSPPPRARRATNCATTSAESGQTPVLRESSNSRERGLFLRLGNSARRMEAPTAAMSPTRCRRTVGTGEPTHLLRGRHPDRLVLGSDAAARRGERNPRLGDVVPDSLPHLG
jgi:nicotinamidase-related amidase